MSVREYIGARYVPIFIGTWDNTQSYEPLSIVQYQGNSYTSRQYVPRGIQIANTDFWIQSGNYNAQVEAYRQEVWTFDNRITANTDAIANHNEAIEKLQAKTAYITPEQFGAIGDGIADDTAAFKAMLSSLQPYDTVVIQSGKEYRITTGLVINTTHVCFTSFGMNESRPSIVFDLGANPESYANFHCIELTQDGCTFSNIAFATKMDWYAYSGASAAGNFIFAVNTQNLPLESHRYDIDAEFFECLFYNAWGVFSIEGRNIWVHNCLFSTIATNCFKIRNFTIEGDRGMRGYRFTNNRFHVAGWIVDTADVTSYPETFNLEFTNNFIDFSKCIYSGISDNVNISGNTIHQTALMDEYLIRLWSSVAAGASCTIEGNAVNTLGSPTSGAQGDIHGLVNITGTVRGFVNIASNTFVTYNAQSNHNAPIIQVVDGNANKVVNIVGNMLHTQNAYTPVQITPTATKTFGTISGNSITSPTATNFITAPSTMTVGDNYTAQVEIE